MSAFTRYAIYYVPPETEGWAAYCTAWLGWDAVQGRAVAHPDCDLPVADITATPRRYGLHATLKPPFRLADGMTRDRLERACAALAATRAPAEATALELAALGRFLALRPHGDESAISALAAACVRALDSFRAPAPPEELHRRRGAGLGAAQEQNLQRWGYPHVMDQFRFHITLTGRLDPDLRAAARQLLHTHLGAGLPRPFRIDTIALAGEAADGRFHLLQRFPLTARPKAHDIQE
jgi:putative phosphonate metabolism protein